MDISIITANGYSEKLETPLVFNAGISIAQTTTHDFIDPSFGKQNIQIVTYYDEISNFQYEPELKQISYSMPFEWTLSNINQTSVVHEEIIIPKEFGALLLSGFSMSVNGIELSDDVVNVDDFFTEGRVVHFIIYQKELLNIFENNSNQNGMNFIIKPDRDYTHLSSVTDNGQFRILVSWEPEILESNSDAKIIFDVKCSSLLPKFISENGGEPIMSRTGHSFIKQKLTETKAELAGEMTGHIFFKERCYGFDDALYTGARLLEIISKSNKSCFEIFDEMPVNLSTPEININFEKHGQQFEAMNKLSADINFPNATIITIDGVRVDYENCWGLVRASNTTPCLVLRFEANDNKSLNEIKTKFAEWLKSNGISADSL